MSTPAWKPLPSARRITTRGVAVAARRRAGRRRAGTSPRPGSAFTGGLSMVTMTTCSRVSERIMRGAYFRAWLTTGGASLWHATLPAGERGPRPALGGDVVADVAIVGAWIHGALDRVRVEAGRSLAAGRGVRARDGRASVRRVATAVGVRRSSPGAATRLRARTDATRSVAMQRAMFDDPRRDRARRRRREDRVRLGAGRDDPGRDDSRAPRAPSRGARRPSAVGLRPRGLPRAVADRRRAR